MYGFNFLMKMRRGKFSEKAITTSWLFTFFIAPVSLAQADPPICCVRTNSFLLKLQSLTKWECELSVTRIACCKSAFFIFFYHCNVKWILDGSFDEIHANCYQLDNI